MSKILILAEKPSLGRDIADALGITQKNKLGHHENNNIVVAPLSGHLLEAKYDLPPYTVENLPLVNLDKPTMVIKSGDSYIKARAKSVLEEIKRADITEIVSAGDADQEGSLLVYEILEYAKVIGKKTITRMWIQALDGDTLKNAYNSRYDIQKDLSYVESARSRALADVRVGFNFSRLFSLKGNLKASVGRVRTAIMQIVRHREHEIENFIPAPFYNIKANFSENIIADMIAGEDNSSRLSEEYYISSVKDKIFNNTTYKVVDVKEEAKKIYPDLLPNQNDILKNISKLHKEKSKKITDAMQTLYEKQFISYPRTEIRFLPTALFNKISDAYNMLLKTYEKDINGSIISFDANNKKIFNDKEVEEHFAVVPWMPKTQSEINSLDDLERKVYDYVVAKFLMACMKPYEYYSSSITLKDDNFTFKATGKTEKEKGFKNYQYITNKTDNKDVILPKVEVNQNVTLLDHAIKKDMTKPPALLSESDLLEILENVNKLYSKQVSTDEEDYYAEKFSLGTPATRAQIIESLLKTYKYIKFNAKDRLETTEDGKKLLNVVGNAIELKMTAYFEKEMQKIHKDKEYAPTFDDMINKYVNDVIKSIVPSISDKKINVTASINTETDLICPICKSHLIKTDKVYKCEKQEYDFKTKTIKGCAFGIWRENKTLGITFEDDTMKEFLYSSFTTPFMDKVYLDLTNKYFMKNILDKTIEPSVVSANCPICKSKLIETDKVYKCENQKYENGKVSGCPFGLFKDMTRTLGKIINLQDLENILQTNKNNPYGTKNKVYLDLDNKYFISTIWEKK